MAQILLAESDRPIGQFIAGILTDFGHDVTVCQGDAEAAALLAIGPIDVLVTDLVLRDGEVSMLSGHCAARGIPTITLRKTVRRRSSKSPSGSTTCNLSSTRWRSTPYRQEPRPDPRCGFGSAEQSGQHRIQALPTGGGRRETFSIEC